MKIKQNVSILHNNVTNCTFIASELDEKVQTGTRENDSHIEWMGDLDIPLTYTDVKNSVNCITDAMKNDEQYYIAWQANIAMSFKDEMSRNGYEIDEKIHLIANDAAKNFLNILIKQ